MSVGKKIKSLRESLGITQEQLAKKLDTTRQAIIKIEKGTQEISIKMLTEASKVLNTTTDYLLSAEIDKPLDFMQSGNITLREYNYIDEDKLDRLLQSAGQYEIGNVKTVQQKATDKGGSLGGGFDITLMGKGVKSEAEGSISKNVLNSVSSELSRTKINKATDLITWINQNPNSMITSIESIEKISKGAMIQLDLDLEQNKFEKALSGIQELMAFVNGFSPQAIEEKDSKMMSMMFNLLTNQQHVHFISEIGNNIKLIGLYRKNMIFDDIENYTGENTVLFKVQKIISSSDGKYELLPKILSKSLDDTQLDNFVKGFSGLNQFGLEVSKDDMYIEGPLIIYEPILSFR